MRSPSRRKRGDAGSTIISLRVVRVVSMRPVLSESVYDIPITLQLVSNCGERKRTVAFPVESEMRYSNRPVVFRSERKETFSICSSTALCISFSEREPELNATSRPATRPWRASSTDVIPNPSNSSILMDVDETSRNGMANPEVSTTLSAMISTSGNSLEDLEAFPRRRIWP